MVQSHLTQLMTLVAMEPPSDFGPDAIRDEKVQVLRSVRKVEKSHVVLGQYASGEIGGSGVVGYPDEMGVTPGSNIPTFAAIRVEIPNYRWSGVPFFLRTGKRLPRRTTQIALTYKHAPVCIFHGVADDCPLQPNVILLTLQPDEGFEVRFELKAPGDPPRVVSKPLYFDYEAEFDAIPDAYQTLLFDVMVGDQTPLRPGRRGRGSMAPVHSAPRRRHHSAPLSSRFLGACSKQPRVGTGKRRMDDALRSAGSVGVGHGETETETAE